VRRAVALHLERDGAFFMSDLQGAAPGPGIWDHSSLDEWLATRSPDICMAVVARLALRNFLFLKSPDPNALLAILHANAMAWYAARYPGQAALLAGFGAAANSVKHNTELMSPGPGNAAAAAYQAAALAGAIYMESSAVSDALVKIRRVLSPMQFERDRAALKMVSNAELWRPISEDVKAAENINSQALNASDPLWLSGTPEWALNRWSRLKAAAKEEHWTPWLEWYQRRVDGRELSEEIERLFAMLPVDPREQAPSEQNALLAERLKTRFEDAPPGIPSQGPGPHVEIDIQTGAITPAKPESLDREGNNVARLRAHHPQVRKLAGDLVDVVNANEQPELYASASSYFNDVNRELSDINFDQLWGEGVFLEEVAAAAARGVKDMKREPLSDIALGTLNALLKVHGPFVLSSRAGLENLALARTFEQRPEEQRQEERTARELVKEFKDYPDVVGAETTAIFSHFIEQPDSTVHPERSAAFKAGMSRNLAINLVAGAALGGIIGSVGALISTTASAATGMAFLPVIEGWKKSRPFLEVSGIVAEGMNNLSEAEIQALWKRLKRIPFDRYKQFVLANEDRLLRLAGRDNVQWLHEHLEWLKRQERQ
jgi:hypothetical protein